MHHLDPRCGIQLAISQYRNRLTYRTASTDIHRNGDLFVPYVHNLVDGLVSYHVDLCK
jgi:hypothetical protein